MDVLPGSLGYPLPVKQTGSLSIAGVAMRADQVMQIANRLGGDALAQKLQRAIANDNTIVALTNEDRTGC